MEGPSDFAKFHDNLSKADEDTTQVGTVGWGWRHLTKGLSSVLGRKCSHYLIIYATYRNGPSSVNSHGAAQTSSGLVVAILAISVGYYLGSLCGRTCNQKTYYMRLSPTSTTCYTESWCALTHAPPNPFHRTTIIRRPNVLLLAHTLGDP